MVAGKGKSGAAHARVTAVAASAVLGMLGVAAHGQPAAATHPDSDSPAEVIAGATGHTSGSYADWVGHGPSRRQTSAVWYRWTAPAENSGDFRFEVDQSFLNVAAFARDELGDLRLVSGAPGQVAVFPVRANAEYHVVVASDRDRADASGDYALTWYPSQRPGTTRNDDIATADPLVGAVASAHFAFADLNSATVEPDEPLESGVRTAWWSWTAPTSARYTWRATPLFAQPMRLAVFEAGVHLATVAETSGASRTEQTLSFDAVAGTRYLVSAGVPGEQALVRGRTGPVVFAWGPAPANDDFANASALTGANGRVAASNRFATIERGERIGLVGGSSVWWTWEGPETRWYRFSLDDRSGTGVVAAYELQGGRRGHEPVAVSRPLPGAVLIMRAEAGKKYALRIGSDGAGAASDFTLSWGPNGTPTWLRYAGAIVDGEVDHAGNVADLGAPNDMTLNSRGDGLYVVTETGLQVYTRDHSGALRHLQTVAGIDPNSRLLWDAHTRSLITVACTGLLRYPTSATGVDLSPPAPIYGTIPCTNQNLADATLLRDGKGTFVHFVSPLGIATLRFNADRTVLSFMRGLPVAGIVAAAMGPEDEFLYAAAAGAGAGARAGEGGLQVFARNLNTGALTRLGRADEDSARRPLQLLTIDPTARYLLGLDADRRVVAFDLANPAKPDFVAQSAPVDIRLGSGTDFSVAALGAQPFRRTSCSLIAPRMRTLAVDAVCEDVAFSARLMPDDRAVRPEDLLRQGGADAFGNNVPVGLFNRGVAASPDGRHIYASTGRGILTFERAGTR